MAETTEVKTIPIEGLYTCWEDDYDTGNPRIVQVLDDVENSAPPSQRSYLSSSQLTLRQTSRSSTPLAARALPCLNYSASSRPRSLAWIPRSNCSRSPGFGVKTSLPQVSRLADVRVRSLQSPRPSTTRDCALNAVLPVSMLAIERFTLPQFLETTSNLLKLGVFLLASNMHPGLLRIAHGSIVDKETESCCNVPVNTHSVQSVEKEVPKWGSSLLRFRRAFRKI